MMEIKPYLLNWIYNNAKKGAKLPNLEEKSITIIENRETEVIPSEGYDGLSKVNVLTNVPTTDLNDYFTTTISDGSSNGAGALQSIKAFPNTITPASNNLNYAFYKMMSLETFPSIDLSNVVYMGYMCQTCSGLKNVPVLNLASAGNLAQMFNGCISLTDESLNNILASLITAVNSPTKTLTYIGLNATQKTKCQTLSNWNDFVNAGWSA